MSKPLLGEYWCLIVRFCRKPASDNVAFRLILRQCVGHQTLVTQVLRRLHSLRYRISCSGGWDLNVHSVGDVKHLSACRGGRLHSEWGRIMEEEIKLHMFWTPAIVGVTCQLHAVSVRAPSIKLLYLWRCLSAMVESFLSYRRTRCFQLR